jgi:hypothetical protein
MGLIADHLVQQHEGVPPSPDWALHGQAALAHLQIGAAEVELWIDELHPAFEAVQALRSLLAPAVQQVGIHAMLQSHRSDRCTGILAHGRQLGLELRGVGAVRAAMRISRGLRVFEHRVHVQFRAHGQSCANLLMGSRWDSPDDYDTCSSQWQ